MTNTELYTAVCLDAATETTMGELEEPLLDTESQVKEVVTDTADLNKSFRTHGLILGFLVQLMNVAGTTYMFLRWGDEKFSVTQEGWFYHALIWIMTQVDLYLYVAMWVTLTAVLTQSGMDYVRSTYFTESFQPSKRSVFVLGVNFYVGVVMGVFFAWTGIDLVLGLPVPVLPMVFVLIFGLMISYTMVWCYDLEDGLETDDEE